MGSVKSLYLRKVVAAVGGADGSGHLRSVGLEPDAAANVGTMIADTAYYDLLERIARDLPDAANMPLRMGATMRCDDYGAFGVGWETAPTLRGSFRRGARYWQVLTSVAEFEVRAEGEDAWFLLHRAGGRRLGLRLSNEATLASALTIMREVAPGAVQPLEVHLPHSAPRAAIPMRAESAGPSLGAATGTGCCCPRTCSAGRTGWGMRGCRPISTRSSTRRWTGCAAGPAT